MCPDDGYCNKISEEDLGKQLESGRERADPNPKVVSKAGGKAIEVVGESVTIKL